MYLDWLKAYEPLFNLSHPKIAQVLGICPQTGLIVLEYCSKSVNGLTVTTLAGLLLQLGNCIPMELGLLALIDTADGVQYRAWRYLATKCPCMWCYRRQLCT